MREGVWIRAAIVLAALMVTAEPWSGSARAAQPPPARSMPSPDGRYVAADGKAKDGYHDTIWLRDVKTGVTIDLLAPGDEKWPGAGGTGIVAWLDNDWIAFMWHCGTGCTSLEVVNVETRSHRYFCTDGIFHLSPDRRHAVGQSDNPYLPGDKRGGLAVIAIDPANAYPTRQDDCKATISGSDICLPDQVLESRAVGFYRWSSDSKSFTYSAIPCVGGQWRAEEKREFHLK